MNVLLTSLRDSLRSLADPEGRITADEGLTTTSLTSSRRAVGEMAETDDANGIALLGKQLSAKDKEREQERLRHGTEVKKLGGEIEKLKSELGTSEHVFMIDSRNSLYMRVEQARTQASTYAAQIQLTDLSKQVEAMKRPFSIYGSQPDPAPNPIVEPTPMEVDSAPTQPPAPPRPEPPRQTKRQPAKRPPPAAAASSSKQALDNLFRPQPEPEPQPTPGPSKATDDDVFAHLPPPSPALSYVDEAVQRPATPEPSPVRRSPRKLKPTSPLRLGAKAGAKRKISDAASPDGDTKLKKAKVDLPQRDAVTASVRGFGSGVVAASSPRPRARGKAAEKDMKAAAAKGKERAAPSAKPSGAAAQKKPVNKPQSKPFDAEVPPSPKPPVLPAFVLPPPSPASRLPSMQIPAEAGPSRVSNDNDNPFAGPSQPPQSAAPASTTAKSRAPVAQSSNKPRSTAPAPSALSAPTVPAVPQTPSRHIFPSNTGRPLAPHMKHAYSPVKPSPLSRILMLADSPDSPEEPPIPKLGAVLEEAEDRMDVDDDDDGDPRDPVSPTPVRRNKRLSPPQEVEDSDDEMSDEEEVEASDAEEVEVLIRGKAKARARADAKPAVSTRMAAKLATRHTGAASPKSKTKAKPKPASPVKLPKEKENARRSPRTRAKLLARARTRSGSSAEGEATRRSTVIGGGIKKTRTSTRTATVKPGPSKSTTPAAVPPLDIADLEPAPPKAKTKVQGKTRSGARRVPIDSSEAAPSVPAWRG